MFSIDPSPSQTDCAYSSSRICIPSDQIQSDQAPPNGTCFPDSNTASETSSSSTTLSSSSIQLSPRSTAHSDICASTSSSSSSVASSAILRSTAVDKHIQRMQQAQHRKIQLGAASTNASSANANTCGTVPSSSSSMDSVKPKCSEFATPTKPKANPNAQQQMAMQMPPPSSIPSSQLPLLTPRSLHTIAKEPNLSCFKAPKSASKNPSQPSNGMGPPPSRSLFNTNPSPAKSLFASASSQPAQRCMSACKTSRPAIGISSRAVNVHERGATPTHSRNPSLNDDATNGTTTASSSILQHDISQLQSSSSSYASSSSSSDFAWSSSSACPDSVIPPEEFSLDTHSLEELTENLREAPEWARLGGQSDIHLVHRLSLSNVTATQSFNIEERRQSLTPGTMATPKKVPAKLKEISSNGKRRLLGTGAKRVLRTNCVSAVKTDKTGEKTAVLAAVANGATPVK